MRRIRFLSYGIRCRFFKRGTIVRSPVGLRANLLLSSSESASLAPPVLSLQLKAIERILVDGMAMPTLAWGASHGNLPQTAALPRDSTLDYARNGQG